MNAKTKLANWLANKKRDYQAGVEIFMELRIDPSKNQFLYTRKPTNIHFNILEKAMVNFARIYNIKPHAAATVVKLPDVAVQKTTSNKVASVSTNNPVNVIVKKPAEPKTVQQMHSKGGKPKIDANPIVRLEDLNEEMKGLYFENGDLSAKIKSLHAELKLASTDETKKTRRSEIAHTLIGYRKKWRHNWDTIDAWWRENQTKTSEQIAAEDALWKNNQIDADLNYIRRYLKSTKTKQQEEVKKRMDRLDEWGIDYEKLVDKVRDKQ